VQTVEKLANLLIYVEIQVVNRSYYFFDCYYNYQVHNCDFAQMSQHQTERFPYGVVDVRATIVLCNQLSFNLIALQLFGILIAYTFCWN